MAAWVRTRTSSTWSPANADTLRSEYTEPGGSIPSPPDYVSVSCGSENGSSSRLRGLRTVSRSSLEKPFLLGVAGLGRTGFSPSPLVGLLPGSLALIASGVGALALLRRSAQEALKVRYSLGQLTHLSGPGVYGAPAHSLFNQGLRVVRHGPRQHEAHGGPERDQHNGRAGVWSGCHRLAPAEPRNQRRAQCQGTSGKDAQGE